MTSFYKAELSRNPEDWGSATISEGIGSSDEHTDRFWRKGPYGIEEDDDGSYEAYVMVADTPFKIGEGFASFSDAVDYLTAQMQEKKVEGEGSEEDAKGDMIEEGIAHLNTPILHIGSDGHEDDSSEDKEDEDSEKTEKSLDGEIALGPEANSVGKSEDFSKSLEGSDDNEGEHEHMTPPHPEDVNEKHYIDNRALGSARLMADAPSLEAFEKSVGDFRSLMAAKNQGLSSMYADPGDPFVFKRADESTSYAELDSFEKAIHSSKIPQNVFTGKNRIGGTEKNPNPGPSKKLAQDRHARENKEGAVVGKKEGGRDLYDRKGWGRRTGPAAHEDYGKWKSGQPVSELEGENMSRGPDAPAHWDKGEERYRDPEKQKERADRMLGRGKWDHFYDNPKTVNTGTGRRTPNQKKGTLPANIQKSDDETFEKAPSNVAINPFGDEDMTNPAVAGQRAQNRESPGISEEEFVTGNTDRDMMFSDRDRSATESDERYRDMYGKLSQGTTPVDYGSELPENPRNSGGPIPDTQTPMMSKQVADLARKLTSDYIMQNGISPQDEEYDDVYRQMYGRAQETVLRSNLIGRIWNNFNTEDMSEEDKGQALGELIDNPHKVGRGMVGPVMMEGIYNDIGRSVYGWPDEEGNDPLRPYKDVYTDDGSPEWRSPALRRREAELRPMQLEADDAERRQRKKADAARREELEQKQLEAKKYLDQLKAGPGSSTTESADQRRQALEFKNRENERYRQQMEEKMTPQPTQTPKPKKPRWTKEQKDAARAQRQQEAGSQEPQEGPAEPSGDTESTKKSWDTELAEKPFRDMLSFERSKRDSEKGIAVGTLEDLKGARMRGSHPIRELYRTVQMGEDKDLDLISPYDPKIHRTDSESKKL